DQSAPSFGGTLARHFEILTYAAGCIDDRATRLGNPFGKSVEHLLVAAPGCLILHDADVMLVGEIDLLAPVRDRVEVNGLTVAAIIEAIHRGGNLQARRLMIVAAESRDRLLEVRHRHAPEL